MEDAKKTGTKRQALPAIGEGTPPDARTSCEYVLKEGKSLASDMILEGMSTRNVRNQATQFLLPRLKPSFAGLDGCPGASYLSRSLGRYKSHTAAATGADKQRVSLLLGAHSTVLVRKPSECHGPARVNRVAGEARHFQGIAWRSCSYLPNSRF